MIREQHFDRHHTAHGDHFVTLISNVPIYIDASHQRLYSADWPAGKPGSVDIGSEAPLTPLQFARARELGWPDNWYGLLQAWSGEYTLPYLLQLSMPTGKGIYHGLTRQRLHYLATADRGYLISRRDLVQRLFVPTFRQISDWQVVYDGKKYNLMYTANSEFSHRNR